LERFGVSAFAGFSVRVKRLPSYVPTTFQEPHAVPPRVCSSFTDFHSQPTMGKPLQNGGSERPTA
jgi:hypothetical protein